MLSLPRMEGGPLLAGPTPAARPEAAWHPVCGLLPVAPATCRGVSRVDSADDDSSRPGGSLPSVPGRSASGRGRSAEDGL